MQVKDTFETSNQHSRTNTKMSTYGKQAVALETITGTMQSQAYMALLVRPSKGSDLHRDDVMQAAYSLVHAAVQAAPQSTEATQFVRQLNGEFGSPPSDLPNNSSAITSVHEEVRDPQTCMMIKSSDSSG